MQCIWNIRKFSLRRPLGVIQCRSPPSFRSLTRSFFFSLSQSSETASAMGRVALAAAQTSCPAIVGCFVPGRGASRHETPYDRPRDAPRRHEPSLPQSSRLHRLVQEQIETAPGGRVRFRFAERAKRARRPSTRAQERRSVPHQGRQMRPRQEQLPRRGARALQPASEHPAKIVRRTPGYIEQETVRSRHSSRFHSISHRRARLAQRQGGDRSHQGLERQESQCPEHRTILRGLLRQ